MLGQRVLPDFISVQFDPSLEDDESGWQFELLQPTPEHVCAIAVRRAGGSRAAIVEHDATAL